MSQKTQSVHIDRLGSGTLPNRIVESIAEMDLSVEEVMKWDQSKPSRQIILRDGRAWVEYRASFSVVKSITIVSTAIGTIWAIIQFVVPLLK